MRIGPARDRRLRMWSHPAWLDPAGIGGPQLRLAKARNSHKARRRSFASRAPNSERCCCLADGRVEGFRPRRGRLVAASPREGPQLAQGSQAFLRKLRPEFGELRLLGGRTKRFRPRRGRQPATAPSAEGCNARPARCRLRSAAGSAEIARSGGPQLRPAKARTTQPTGRSPRP